MPLTLSAIDALLADNTSGDISAADMRTIVRALHRKNVGAYSLDHADDIWWESELGGLTTLTVTGSQTLTEKDGFLSAAFATQTANDLNCVLKPHTFSTGDSYAVRLAVIGGSTFSMAGLVVSDGTTSTSNAVALLTYINGFQTITTWHGTLTNMGTQANVIAMGTGVGMPWMGLHFKIDYTSANTFRSWASPDGVSWADLGFSTYAKTMTPTHFGVCWSTWGGSGYTAAATFGPVCKVA